MKLSVVNQKRIGFVLFKNRIQNMGSLDKSLSPTYHQWRKLGFINRTSAAKNNPLPWWKRFLDLTCILVSVPGWFSALVLVAIWIKLVSRGPLLFCQERLGYRGKAFKMFKFRTMEVNVETRSHELYFQQLVKADCPMTKLDVSGDPRIVCGGRILRALGLDELPQLLNVLRKEMSLVGPRPCTATEFSMYEDWQRQRLDALPGLTGYWQVNGKNRTTFQQMIEMDIYYSTNASLWLDVMILLRTVPAILGQLIESRICIDRRKILVSAPVEVAPGPVGESVPSSGSEV
jgi:lipopolysaccharide/colanic/teichoic acid biosynthesis glycosyltransferase